MDKKELESKLILLGFKRTNESPTKYEYLATNEYARVVFIHNQQVRVLLDYPMIKGGQYCTYSGALLWICENAKQN